MLGSVLAIDRQAAQLQMLSVMWGGSLPVSGSVRLGGSLGGSRGHPWLLVMASWTYKV